MMMSLGMFVFELRTVPFQELERMSEWRHAANNRLGMRPRRQYLGPGDDTVTLSGELRPEITGGSLSLDALRVMADTGKAWVLVAGTGRIYGLFTIESLKEGNSDFLRDGTPRKVSFALTLKRADNNSVDKLGNLAISSNGAR